MTNIGIIRKVDSLGRITLPKEFRRVFDMNNRDEIEMLATKQGILLRKSNIKLTQLNRNN